MEALLYKTNNKPPILDEGQLIKQCQLFDPQAQELLYQQYADKMYHVSLRYLSEEMEAEDTVVEGFVKIFNKIDTFEYRGKGSLNGWIKRIIVNESLMKLRKRKMLKVDLEGTLQLSSGESIDSPIFEEEILNEVKKLPKGYRTVFNMYVIEGYCHKDIAKHLGISENTSKSQLSKARASLSKTLIRIGAI
ncbi:MAG: sigma-70 family RNA polymerase sigma factor [Reichenbachiella sp.]